MRARTTSAAAPAARTRRQVRTAGPAARDPAHIPTDPGAEPGAAGEPPSGLSAAPATEPTPTERINAQTEDVTTDEMLTEAGSGTAPGAGPGAAAASRKRVRRQAAPRTSTPHTSTLELDLEAVTDVTGLAQEVALLRASIRRLAKPNTDTAEHVKVLAELRHQIEALCTALKTQQALEGNGDARAAELARVLDELGDQLGVPR